MTKATRWAWIISLVAISGGGLVLVFLLALSTNNRRLYEQHFEWLLWVNVAVATVLALVIVIAGARLLLRLRRRKFGSRLLAKLAGIFALVGVIPGLVIYTVSYQFVTRSIESWFDVEVEAALDAGLNLGRVTLDTLVADLANKTRASAERLASEGRDAALALAIERIRDSSTTIGVAAAVGAIWIGASFWGAMDTAFCRIYHVECRGWLEQKRFALLMLLVVTVFLAASVVIPLAENLAVSSADDLPFGLDRVQGLRSVAVLAVALTITFAIVSLIYYVVPKGHVPWHAVWPGALFVTVTTAIANAAFPFYLTEISDLERLGGALGFILVALIWFYIVALALLAGAVINALRYEVRDTGSIDLR